jgi:DNA-binding NarL/FixJ family response regulator
MNVVAFITDFFFQAKVAEAAKQVGVELKLVKNLWELFPALEKNPRLVIVDLEAEGIDGPALISQMKSSRPGLSVVAFAPHVQDHLLRQAQQSGADQALPRSKFSRDLAKILQGEGTKNEE